MTMRVVFLKNYSGHKPGDDVFLPRKQGRVLRNQNIVIPWLTNERNKKAEAEKKATAKAKAKKVADEKKAAVEKLKKIKEAVKEKAVSKKAKTRSKAIT